MVAGGHIQTIVLVEPDPRESARIRSMVAACRPDEFRLRAVERLADAAALLHVDPASIVLLDISPPDGAARLGEAPHRAALHDEGLDAVAQLRMVAPAAAIVVLVDDDDEPEALAAISAGAQDYLVKPELSPTSLCRALKLAAARARAAGRLAHQALHDQLTGLPNRALFLDRLGVALDRCRRSGGSVAVLFLDVDDFKEINDSLGHAAGDRVLIGLADRLRALLRPMDTVCRYGGDEFTLLFEDLESERQVIMIAERISQAAALPVALDHGAAEVTVSIGVALVSDPSVAVDTVIREADAAMYRAKRAGRARFELSDEGSRQRALERLELEHELNKALDRGELSVDFQPIFALDERGGVAALEALVRWRHPRRGVIAPEEFIALADETGLAIPIGRHVIQRVLRAVPRWRSQAPGLVVSVNLSPRELADGGLLPMLAAELHETAVPPRALCLEVTESAIAANPDAALTTLRGLKAMGVRLAIDDFGLGSSSLTNLKRLPIDALKLHPSLLGGLGGSPREASIVGAVVELGHALGLSVVAEGVERDDELEELRALGCDHAQGFRLARPMPEDDVHGLLAAEPTPPANSRPSGA